jgi:hypothetical protein
MNQDQKQPEKRHYYLFTGEVNVLDTPDSETIHTIRLNAVSPMKNNFIRAMDLGIAQAAMQRQFMERMPQGWSGTVVEVILINISYLGLMTNEEFIQQEPTKQSELVKQAQDVMASMGVVGAHI